MVKHAIFLRRLNRSYCLEGTMFQFLESCVLDNQYGAIPKRLFFLRSPVEFLTDGSLAVTLYNIPTVFDEVYRASGCVAAYDR